MKIAKVWSKTVDKYFNDAINYNINKEIKEKILEFRNFSIDYENKKILYFGDDIQLAKSIVPEKYLDICKR